MSTAIIPESLRVPEILIDHEERARQEQQLKKYILDNKTGRNKINVLSYEASFGKSRLTDMILRDTDEKVLYVKKFNEEQDVSARNIIGEVVGEDEIELDAYISKVLVINRFNSKENENIKSNIYDAKVVIISHKKYQLLSDNDEMQSIYSYGRKILIIDEYIEPVLADIGGKFDEDNYGSIFFRNNSSLFPLNIRNSYYKTIEEVFTEVINQVKKRSKNNDQTELINSIYDVVDELGLELRDKLGNDIANLEKWYNDVGKKDYDRDKKNYKYAHFFKVLRSFLNQQILFNKRFNRITFSTFIDFDYMTLENNVILDASGVILYDYHLRPGLFNIVKQDLIYDYSYTNCLTYENYKITRTAIEKNFGNTYNSSLNTYYESIINHLQKLENIDDKTLIITYMDHEKIVKNIISTKKSEGLLKSKIDINHYNNLVGKNDWRDFNKIYLPVIYNPPEYVFLLYYAYITKKQLTLDDLEVLYDDKRNRMFSNKKIEILKICYQMHHVYQACKRINRDLSKLSNFYVVTSNKSLKNGIKRLFKNIKMQPEEFELHLEEYIKGETKKKKIKLNLTKKDLVEKLLNDPNGDLSIKKNFAEYYGCTTNTLKRKIIKDAYFGNYIDMEKTFKTGCRKMYLKNNVIKQSDI